MKKSYDSISALKADLKKDINESLADDVFQEVKKCELEHIKEDVLSVYTPYIYQRRAIGGIDDPNNIIGTVDDGTLTVENITPFNPGYGTENSGQGLAELINSGDGAGGHQYDYAYRNRLPYTDARPFIDNTIDELEQSGRLDASLIKGLRKRGVDIK